MHKRKRTITLPYNPVNQNSSIRKDFYEFNNHNKTTCMNRYMGYLLICFIFTGRI